MALDARRRLGSLGERLAGAHLEAHGLAVLDRNFRTPHGELDLVAGDDRVLVFCEVKTRVARDPGSPGPLVGIGGRKRRRVRSIARQWLAQRGGGGPRPPELRFDAIGVTLDRAGRLVSLEHLEGAF